MSNPKDEEPISTKRENVQVMLHERKFDRKQLALSIV
jgi:hypothetical protein